MLLVGLLFPIPPWLLHRKYPKFGFNYVFTPILVGKDPSLRICVSSVSNNFRS
jgi:hypothetical protein